MVASCKSVPLNRRPIDSSVESLAANEGGNILNQVIAFGSPGSGDDFLPAVKIDIDSLAAPFSHPRVGFRVKTFYDNLSYDTLITETEHYARAVEEKGTLVWIFSGHGYDAGELMVDREVLKFSHIAKAILRARADRPLKRLVVIVDACYSGNLIDGTKPVSDFRLFGTDSRREEDVSGGLDQALIREAVAEFAPLINGSSDGFALATRAFTEVIVLTSSRKTEKSNSHKTKGSQMLRALNLVLSEVAAPESHYSIGGFLSRVVFLTKQLNSEPNEEGRAVTPQNPLFQVLPKEVGTQDFTSAVTPGANPD